MGERLGQHFLSDAGWRGRIARAVGIASESRGRERAPGGAEELRAIEGAPEEGGRNRAIGVRPGIGSPEEGSGGGEGSKGSGANSDRLWVEIGAGHGEMTRLLAASGARVIAVELDPKLHPRLLALTKEFPRVELVAGDILTQDLGKLTGGSRFSVYGNLPYYITSPILHHVFKSAGVLEDVYVVTQLEVAARIAARPGSRQFGYFSVFTQYHARAEIILRIPPGAFRPPPKVTSALVRLKPPGESARLAVRDEERFFDFVKLCFGQKRKTLLNNLRPVAAPKLVAEVIENLGLGANVRAEQIEVAQFAGIYRRLIPE